MRVWFQNHNLSDTNHRQHKNLIHIPDIYRKNPQLQCIAFLFPLVNLKRFLLKFMYDRSRRFEEKIYCVANSI